MTEWNDRIIMALIGIGLLRAMVLEDKWQQAYTILFSLHANQIHYLDRQNIFSGKIALPNGVSRCMVALYGVRACLEVNEPGSAVLVLDASDWAESTTPNSQRRFDENNQRMHLLRRLVEALINKADLNKAMTCLRKILDSLVNVPGQVTDVLASAGAACSRIVAIATEGSEADLDFALGVHDLFMRHKLQCDKAMMRAMLSGLIRCAVSSDRMRIARQLYIQALNQQLYPPANVGGDRHSVALPASELTAADAFLTIEKHLFDLAKYFQHNHRGSEPWSFAVGPRLKKQPATVRLHCAPPGQAAANDAVFDQAVSVVKKVLNTNFSPPLDIGAHTVLNENTHCIVVDVDRLVRWFNANDIDPYVTASVMQSLPTPSGSPSPTLNADPGHDLPRDASGSGHQRRDSRAISGGGLHGPRAMRVKDEAGHSTRRSMERHHLEARSSERRPLESRPAQQVRPSPPSHQREASRASRGPRFENMETLRRYVAKRICRRLTKMLRIGRFGEVRGVWGFFFSF